MHRLGALPLKNAVIWNASCSGTSRRCLHASSVRAEITKFTMPAMSPTMNEGGIAQWKVKEGQPFSAGDVLLEVETDKATIDVEAQDDGVLGKIIAPDGAKSIAVGQIIALLAEEGDDISNLETPNEDSAKSSPPREEAAQLKAPEPPQQTSSSAHSPSTPAKHDDHVSSSRPLFPSVLRLLAENGIGNADKIKGTGIRGMLTKGDILAHLGKISSPVGSYKTPKSIFTEVTKPKEERKPLDGPAIRQAIVSSFLQSSARSRTILPPVIPYDFDSVISDYLPSETTQSKPASVPPSTPAKASADFLDGLI